MQCNQYQVRFPWSRTPSSEVIASIVESVLIAASSSNASIEDHHDATQAVSSAAAAAVQPPPLPKSVTLIAAPASSSASSSLSIESQLLPTLPLSNFYSDALCRKPNNSHFRKYRGARSKKALV
jgi:hypothetical protein